MHTALKSVPPTPPVTRPINGLSRLVQLALTALAVASVYLLFRNSIHFRLANLFDPFSHSGDSLQHLAPLWFVRHPERAAHDYIATYYLSAILPPLFKWIYAVATMFAPPLAASKVVTLFLSIFCILAAALTSKHVVGGAAAYLSLLFSTGAILKNFYFIGGIQRGFGISLASLALYCACSGRIAPIGILALVAAILYPAAAVFLLVLLTIVLLLPRSARGSASSWSLAKRIGFLTCCGICCCLAVLPQIVGGHRYGARLSITDQDEYPEWGAQGRYTDGDRGVPIAFLPKVLGTTVAALSPAQAKAERSGSVDNSNQPGIALPSHRQRCLIIVALTGLALVWIAYTRRLKASPEAVRCAAFALTTPIAFGMATVLFPVLYIPSRYVILGCIPLIPVVFPSIWCSAISLFSRNRWLCSHKATPVLLSLSLGGAVFVGLGWLHLSLHKLPSASGHLPLFRFVRTLPPDAVIAGWPRGVLNQIPLFTARTALLFEEGHQIFHRDFIEETRKRMRSIIALYSATDPHVVSELQAQFKVTHILLDTRHLDRPPPYFAPFDREIEAARSQVAGKPLVLAELARSKAVFRLGHLVVIELEKKPGAS